MSALDCLPVEMGDRTPKSLQVRAVSSALFAPYGELVHPGPSVLHNEGRGVRRDLAAGVTHDPRAARLWLSTTDIKPSPAPVSIRLLERHPLSSQLFAPISGGPLLVAVAPSDAKGAPHIEKLEAFVVPPGVGLNYAAGVWHAPLVALEETARLMIVMWACDGPEDCEEITLAAPQRIVLAPGG